MEFINVHGSSHHQPDEITTTCFQGTNLLPRPQVQGTDDVRVVHGR